MFEGVGGFGGWEGKGISNSSRLHRCRDLLCTVLGTGDGAGGREGGGVGGGGGGMNWSYGMDG